MRTWLLRGCVFAVLNAVAQTGIAAVAVYHAGTLTWLRPLALGLLAGIGVLWGAVDTWFRRLDRGVNWVKAAVLAGLLAGVLAVIGRAAFVDETGIWALEDALTGGAAFTALLVLIPAGLGLLLGLLLEPHAAADHPLRGRNAPRTRTTGGSGGAVEGGKSRGARSTTTPHAGTASRSAADAPVDSPGRPARARHRRTGISPNATGSVRQAGQPRSEERSAPSG